MSEVTKMAVKIIQVKIIIPRMEQLGVSQYRLAELSGLNRSTIKRWFDGDIDLSLENFLSILGALQIRPYFVAGEDDDTEMNYIRVMLNKDTIRLSTNVPKSSTK